MKLHVFVPCMHLLFAEKGGKLAALSVASCQLNDADLVPLCTAIKGGYGMQMLKLSDNRFTDDFVSSLCDALQSQKGHSLALIDLSNTNVSVGNGINI